MLFCLQWWPQLAALSPWGSGQQLPWFPAAHVSGLDVSVGTGTGDAGEALAGLWALRSLLMVPGAATRMGAAVSQDA